MYKSILLVFLVLLDILSKKIISNNLELSSVIKINSYLEIVHIHNYGISFGMLSNNFSPIFFILIGILLTLVIFYMMLKTNNFYEKWGYFSIISGATANILDRIFNGYVIDFINFHYNYYFWPAFNFADIYISFGIIMILTNFLNNIKNASNK